MCDLRRATPGAIALLLLAVQPARGQEADATLERLRVRADSLEQALAGAERRLPRPRPAARADDAVTLDTQRVGPLTVVSERRHSVQAHATVRRALAELGDVPEVVEHVLDSTYFVLGLGGDADAFDVEERAGMRAVRLTLPRWMPRPVQVRRVAQSIGVALARALPEDLRAWSGSAGVPIASDGVYREAYRSIALSTSPAARACFDAAVARCMDALSLTEPGARWQAWYDEAGLVAWAVSEARRESARGHESRRAEAERACEAGRTYAACRALIEQRGGPPQPLPPIARASLLTYVLEEGGAEAWAVLATDTTAALRDRLAAAAGTDADALIEAWRARVAAERPTGFADLGRSSTATLVWVVLLAALASRSTRWRLG